MIKDKAYAKINLGLKVLKKRPDGFHNIETIITKISLYDEISMKKISGKKIIFHCNIKELENEDNLVYKVAKTMIDTYNINSRRRNQPCKKCTTWRRTGRSAVQMQPLL